MDTRLKLHHTETCNKFKESKVQFYVGIYGFGYTREGNGSKSYYIATERQKNVTLHIGGLFYIIRRKGEHYTVWVSKDGVTLAINNYNEKGVKHGAQMYYDTATETWHEEEYINGKR